MNSLGVDNEDTEDDDDESSDDLGKPMQKFAITECPPKEQVATHNKFEALASESEDRHKPVNIGCINRFAHYVHHGKKMSQKKTKAVKSVKIPTEQDMHKAKHFTHALPIDKETLDRIAKLCPTSSENLGKNAIWVMADTGSTWNGMDVRKEIPGYAK